MIRNHVTVVASYAAQRLWAAVEILVETWKIYNIKAKKQANLSSYKQQLEEQRPSTGIAASGDHEKPARECITVIPPVVWRVLSSKQLHTAADEKLNSGKAVMSEILAFFFWFLYFLEIVRGLAFINIAPGSGFAFWCLLVVCMLYFHFGF